MGKTQGLSKFPGLRLCSIKTLSDLKNRSLDNVKIVEIHEKLEAGLWRPNTIVWRRQLKNNDLFADIPSKKTRKLMRSIKERASGIGLVVELSENISKQQFLEWFRVYKRRMSEKEHVATHVGPDWYEKKLVLNQPIGSIVIRQNKQFLGGSLFLMSEEGILNVGYSAFEQARAFPFSLRALIEVYFLEYARSKGYQEVGRGRDTNFYGYHLAPGIFEYKRRYGYRPVIDSKAEFASTFILDFSQFSDPVITVSLPISAGSGSAESWLRPRPANNNESSSGKDQPVVNIIYRQGSPNSQKYQVQGLSMRLYSQTQIVALHQKWLQKKLNEITAK